MQSAFQTHCQRKNLEKVRTFMREALEPYNLSNELQYRIVLAVDEACSNAIIHGNNCNANKKITVELKVDSNRLDVKIYDIGQYSKEVAKQKDPDLRQKIAEKAKGGLGLRLMFAIMDEVQFYTKNKKNICCLSKELN